MTIFVNGVSTVLPISVTLEAFLLERKLPAAKVVVELNGKISLDFKETLKDGDQLEIIQMVGGG